MDTPTCLCCGKVCRDIDGAVQYVKICWLCRINGATDDKKCTYHLNGPPVTKQYKSKKIVKLKTKTTRRSRKLGSYEDFLKRLKA